MDLGEAGKNRPAWTNYGVKGEHFCPARQKLNHVNLTPAWDPVIKPAQSAQTFRNGAQCDNGRPQ